MPEAGYEISGARVFKMLEQMGPSTRLECGTRPNKSVFWACYGPGKRDRIITIRDTPHDAIRACYELWSTQ